MSDLARIAALLESDRPEVQIAAALVLGELECKDPACLHGLTRLVESGVEGLQLAALGALERIASPKVMPALLAALTGREAVAQAAVRALGALGESAIPKVQALMKDAPAPLKVRLSEVLAHIAGGKGILPLLEGFYAQDRETALRQAVQVRHEVRGADPKARRHLALQVEKFLSRAKTQASEAAMAAAIRVLGYLEDEASTKTLLQYAIGKKLPSAVRVEALIALRFSLAGHRDAPEVVRGLLPLVLDGESAIARAAFDTLAGLSLARGSIPTLVKVAFGADADRARIAVGCLGSLGEAAAESLVEIGLGAPPPIAEEALRQLGARTEAKAALLGALLGCKRADQESKLVRFLRPHATRFSESEKGALVKAARARVKSGIERAEPILALLHEADAVRFATLLRQEAGRAATAGHARALYASLCRTPQATEEDRLALARHELLATPLDFALHARQSHRGLALFAELARRGAPLAEQILKDRTIDPEHCLYVGFHLSELPEGEGRDAGEEILAGLAQGRSKVARQARNKLKTSGLSAST